MKYRVFLCFLRVPSLGDGQRARELYRLWLTSDLSPTEFYRQCR